MTTTVRRMGKAKRAHHVSWNKDGGHGAERLCPPYRISPHYQRHPTDGFAIYQKPHRLRVIFQRQPV